MAIADQQIAWPRKRPSTPADLMKRCAMTMATPIPISHAVAMAVPGYATHTAPPARRPASQLPAKATISDAMMVRKNDRTPKVIARDLVLPSRVIRNDAASRTTSERMATPREERCGHQTTKNEKNS